MFKICRPELKHLFAVVIFIKLLQLSTEKGIHNSSFWSTESISLSHGYYHNNYLQTIIEHPSDQQAKIGDKVLFRCRIRNLRGEPQWCIDDFCLGLAKTTTNGNRTDINFNISTSHEQHLKGRPRYRIVGDRARGEFNLQVEPVQLQDNMFFYCMVTAASETVKAVKSKKAFLTVLSKFFS